MSNALSKLKSKKFSCSEAKEISDYIQSILKKKRPTSDEEELTDFIVSVPLFLDVFSKVAKENNQQKLIQPILNSIKEYFFEAEDLIPDHHGVFGLLDDTYMVYCYMDQVNNYWMTKAGVPFWQVDLSSQRYLIATVIGEQNTKTIESHVQSSFDGQVLVETMKTVGKYALGGLAIMFAASKLMGGGNDNSDRWSEVMRSEIDHIAWQGFNS